MKSVKVLREGRQTASSAGNTLFSERTLSALLIEIGQKDRCRGGNFFITSRKAFLVGHQDIESDRRPCVSLASLPKRSVVLAVLG